MEGGSRLKIGYMMGFVTNEYSSSLAQGVKEAVTDAGHVFVRIGDELVYQRKQQNLDNYRLAFELANRLELDAYVLSMGVLSQTPEPEFREEYQKLADVMNPRRTVLLDEEKSGFRVIVKDNKPGMRECLQNLIYEHGYKRIAFISGSENSRSAKERESIYFEEMQKAGLETDEQLFWRAPFYGECRDVVAELLDTVTEIEAIACATDRIAFSCYEEIKRRGLRVGRDIAVTGFDDLPASATMDPPLSTVHASAYDMGYIGGLEAIRLAEGKEQKTFTLSSYFVCRASCGEEMLTEGELFHSFLNRSPMPMMAIVEQFAENGCVAKDGAIYGSFVEKTLKLMEYGVEAYYRYQREFDPTINLFTEAMLSDLLLDPQIREKILIEGVQTMFDAFMHALRQQARYEERVWLADQTATFHRIVSRIFHNNTNTLLLRRAKQEMLALDIMDDAILESTNEENAFSLIMRDVGAMGMDYAKVFMLKSVASYSGEEITLGNSVYLRGSVVNGMVETRPPENNFIPFERLIGFCDATDALPKAITVCALASNGETGGVAVLNDDAVDLFRQNSILKMMTYAIKHLHMIREEQSMIALLNEHNVRLTHQSQQDELTGLLNRRGFLTTIDVMLNNNIDRSAAFFYLDLDGLKTINDTYGHEVGDEAIRHTAGILKECFRSSDILCRQGGDEFVAFAVLEKEEDAQRIIDRITERMERFNNTHSLLYRLSISIGDRTFVINTHSIMEQERLMSEADAKLYEMKKAKKGKKRFEEEKKR